MFELGLQLVAMLQMVVESLVRRAFTEGNGSLEVDLGSGMFLQSGYILCPAPLPTYTLLPGVDTA